MKLPAEQIYEALFQNICQINTPATPLKTMGRRWIKWDQLGDVKLPAFYQRQRPDGIGVSQKVFGASKYHLHAELWFYFATDVGNINGPPTSPMLNNYFTAVDNIMRPTVQSAGGARQQLGLGIGIENAWIDGEVGMDEGLVAPPAILMIPITITTG